MRGCFSKETMFGRETSLTKCADLSRACHLPILTVQATVFIPLSATGSIRHFLERMIRIDISQQKASGYGIEGTFWLGRRD